MSKQGKSHFDCCIVGGGMVGAVLALGLANIGYSVVVIEQNEPQAFAPEQAPDLRLSAFNMHSVNMLQQLGAWQHINNMRLREYDCLRTWDAEMPWLAGHNKATSFYASDVGYTELGFFIENRLVQLALYQQIKAAYSSTVDFVFGQSITDINCEEGSVKLSGGQTIHASVLFGAEGANSMVRQAANIGTTGWQYSQRANGILIETEDTLPNETWQAFYHTGPRALLPMYDNYACLIWYDNIAQSRWISEASDAELHSAIIHSFPELRTRFTLCDRASFGLTRMHANQYARDRAILVGDAAHTINPLAGQGVNLGFKDVSALLSSIANHGIIDIPKVIKEYESSRRLPNLLMMSTMDALYKGFSTPIFPIKALRGVGLRLAEKAGPIKDKALKYAMGL